MNGERDYHFVLAAEEGVDLAESVAREGERHEEALGAILSHQNGFEHVDVRPACFVFLLHLQRVPDGPKCLLPWLASLCAVLRFQMISLMKFSSPKSLVEHHLHVVAGVPVAVIVEAAGAFENAGKLLAARAHEFDVGLGRGVAVVEGTLLLGLAPEHFVVAV